MKFDHITSFLGVVMVLGVIGIIFIKAWISSFLQKSENETKTSVDCKVNKMGFQVFPEFNNIIGLFMRGLVGSSSGSTADESQFQNSRGRLTRVIQDTFKDRTV